MKHRGSGTPQPAKKFKMVHRRMKLQETQLPLDVAQHYFRFSLFRNFLLRNIAHVYFTTTAHKHVFSCHQQMILTSIWWVLLIRCRGECIWWGAIRKWLAWLERQLAVLFYLVCSLLALHHYIKSYSRAPQKCLRNTAQTTGGGVQLRYLLNTCIYLIYIHVLSRTHLLNVAFCRKRSWNKGEVECDTLQTQK